LALLIVKSNSEHTQAALSYTYNNDPHTIIYDSSVEEKAESTRLNLRQWSNDWQSDDISAIQYKNYWPRV